MSMAKAFAMYLTCADAAADLGNFAAGGIDRLFADTIGV
jgi:hypothetical protein